MASETVLDIKKIIVDLLELNNPKNDFDFDFF